MENKELNQLSVGELETALLCAVLIAPEQLPDIATIIDHTMFEDPKHGFIYKAIHACFEKGELPDYLTVENEMRRQDNEYTRRIGGINCLAESIARVRHGDNLQLYAAEIKRLFLLRKLDKLFLVFREKAMLYETDPFVLISEVQQEMINLEQTVITDEAPLSTGQITADAIQTHRRMKNGGGGSGRLTTGLLPLDALTGGFQNGELIVIAGRPGDGKTALSLFFALHAAKAKKNILMFNLETTNLQTANRIFIGHSDINHTKFRNFVLEDNDLLELERVQKEMEELPLWIKYNPQDTIDDIWARAIAFDKKVEIHGIFADYLQLVNMPPRNGLRTDQLVGDCIKRLHKLGQLLECPVVVTAQLNRESEKRADLIHRPRVSELRDSGVIEQEADTIILMTCPAHHGTLVHPKTDEDLTDVVHLHVDKNRHGRHGFIKLKKNKTFTSFADAH